VMAGVQVEFVDVTQTATRCEEVSDRGYGQHRAQAEGDHNLAEEQFVGLLTDHLRRLPKTLQRVLTGLQRMWIGYELDGGRREERAYQRRIFDLVSGHRLRDRLPRGHPRGEFRLRDGVTVPHAQIVQCLLRDDRLEASLTQGAGWCSQPSHLRQIHHLAQREIGGILLGGRTQVASCQYLHTTR
jgi:hypothetical protein